MGALVGFKNFLRVRGVGYRFQLVSKKLIINVGYSHSLQIKLPLKHKFILNKKSTFFFLTIILSQSLRTPPLYIFSSF